MAQHVLITGFQCSNDQCTTRVNTWDSGKGTMTCNSCKKVQQYFPATTEVTGKKTDGEKMSFSVDGEALDPTVIEIITRRFSRQCNKSIARSLDPWKKSAGTATLETATGDHVTYDIKTGSISAMDAKVKVEHTGPVITGAYLVDSELSEGHEIKYAAMHILKSIEDLNRRVKQRGLKRKADDPELSDSAKKTTRTDPNGARAELANTIFQANSVLMKTLNELYSAQ